ncbi:MAG: hypothetical protein NTW68_02855 [candidate division NC10 bacterium]|nr:hypothetical protein [candidate division NC10 bacterium]
MQMVALLVMATWVYAGAAIGEAAGPPGGAQGLSLPAEIAGWKWDGAERQYDSRSVFDYIDGAGEMFLAYGFQNLTVRRFEKAGQPPLTLDCYEMGSAADAYGVFSFERQEATAGIGQGSEFGGGLLRFWKGQYFVAISADGEGVEAESAVLELGRRTAAAIPATGPEPRVVGLIPGKDAGLVEASVRYLTSHVLLNLRLFISHENILNLTRRTEAVLAQYGQGSQKTHLLLVRWPEAAEAGDAYQKFLAVYLSDAGGKDRRMTADRRWTIAWRRNEFVLVVFGAPTESDGEKLLQATEGRLRGGR